MEGTMWEIGGVIIAVLSLVASVLALKYKNLVFRVRRLRPHFCLSYPLQPSLGSINHDKKRSQGQLGLAGDVDKAASVTKRAENQPDFSSRLKAGS